MSCEISCDQQTLKGTEISGKIMYFRSMLDYAVGGDDRVSHLCSFVGREKKSVLERRVEYMFKKTGKSNLLKRTAAAVCILAVGIGVFSVASILNNGEGGDSPEIDKVITCLLYTSRIRKNWLQSQNLQQSPLNFWSAKNRRLRSCHILQWEAQNMPISIK